LKFILARGFYYRLWHIVGFEIKIIVVGTSFQVDGALMKEKRSEFDVIADVLRVAALGSKESEIMTGCDLNRDLLEKYMPAMVVLKLVGVEKESENLYRTTSRGLEFLRFYHGLRWLLWGKDFDFLLINILTRLKKDRHPYYVR
jgi:predicted transcriptional regulator